MECCTEKNRITMCMPVILIHLALLLHLCPYFSPLPIFHSPVYHSHLSPSVFREAFPLSPPHPVLPSFAKMECRPIFYYSQLILTTPEHTQSNTHAFWLLSSAIITFASYFPFYIFSNNNMHLRLFSFVIIYRGVAIHFILLICR